MDRVINIIINTVIRRFVNAGINKGMKAVSSTRKPKPKQVKQDDREVL